MRQMKHSTYGTVVNVTEFAMTRNMWEYFITDEKFNDDIVCAVVKGFECEMGEEFVFWLDQRISLSEIKPYVLTRSNDLEELEPAPGWEWVS